MEPDACFIGQGDAGMHHSVALALKNCQQPFIKLTANSLPEVGVAHVNAGVDRPAVGASRLMTASVCVSHDAATRLGDEPGILPQAFWDGLLKVVDVGGFGFERYRR